MHKNPIHSNTYKWGFSKRKRSPSHPPPKGRLSRLAVIVTADKKEVNQRVGHACPENGYRPPDALLPRQAFILPHGTDTTVEIHRMGMIITSPSSDISQSKFMLDIPIRYEF